MGLDIAEARLKNLGVDTGQVKKRRAGLAVVSYKLSEHQTSSLELGQGGEAAVDPRWMLWSDGSNGVEFE
jgi:hypothetical protein